MADELRSPIRHHLVLHRREPERGVARFYSIMIERDLFGTVRLVRNWGRGGAPGARPGEAAAGLPGFIRVCYQVRTTMMFCKSRWGQL
jgi:hypothetical protein